MTKIKLGEKELNIKFGYEATLKSGIIAKIVQLDQIEDGVESVNAVLMLLPELILVGVQKFHEKEFGYDPNNEEQKEKQMKLRTATRPHSQKSSARRRADVRPTCDAWHPGR